MSVLPHPHTGLQTVTWPLAGEIHHRDSVGSDVVVRPGQLNLMTGGRGIAHSEISTGERRAGARAAAVGGAARGVGRHGARVRAARRAARVRAGTASPRPCSSASWPGERSPATVFTPLVGADLQVAADARATVALRPDFEHAVLAIDSTLVVSGVEVPPSRLLYLGTGRSEIMLSAASRPGRAVLLGGEPFGDELVMWWNFVGRSHDEIAAARADWEADGQTRFGAVAGHGGARIPAPELPGVRLTPRRHRHRH